MDRPLAPDMLRKMHAYWRAANYLSIGQIYLYDNPLLKEPLKLEHIKPRLLGHWGTTPGLNFIYVHLNRIIQQYDLNMIYVTGPGHGGPGLVANTYLEGTYSELYPNVSQDEQGVNRLFKRFSFPGGIPRFPDLKVRVINVVNLMTLEPQSEHPHGLSDKDFDVLFTKDKPIIFPFHGYPLLIHRLTYRRTNHRNLHVRGYKEEGTTATPFDMVVLNDLDRYHLVGDVIDRVASLGSRAAYAKQFLRDKLLDHKAYISRHGEDMPEVRNWKWELGGHL